MASIRIIDCGTYRSKTAARGDGRTIGNVSEFGVLNDTTKSPDITIVYPNSLTTMSGITKTAMGSFFI